MFSERTLLDAIVASPDDDAPRLAYADWLEERGDPRSELIRVQCQSAAMRCGQHGWAQLRKHEYFLLRDQAKYWSEIFHGVDLRDVVFDRGLLVEIALTAESFLKHGEAIVEAAPPTFRGVRLVHLGAWTPRLVNKPFLQKLSVLRIWQCELLDSDAQLWANCEYLSSLEELEFDTCGMRPQGAAALIASPHLANLTALDLTRNILSGVRAFNRCAFEKRLATLTLSNCRLGDYEVEIFAMHKRFPCLKTLDLSDNHISEETGVYWGLLDRFQTGLII